MVADLIRRSEATQATLDKYRGRPFDWAKARTCIHMARFHLAKLGKKVPKVPQVRSELGARKVMKARKWKTAADIIDAVGLERIAPAQMLLGDIAYRHGDESDLGGLLICVGPHKLLGWFENEETEGRMVVMDMSFDQLDAAWRA